MLPYFWYLLKVMICSGILFGYYWFFLRNKIFHRYNRFYLLAAMSVALLLPLFKIDFWLHSPQQNQAIRVLQAVSVGDEYMNNMVITAQKSNWSFEQLYAAAYWFISIIFLFVLIRTIYLIRTLLKQYPVQQIETIAFVNTNDDSTPFSFLKYIFWNSNIDLDTTTGRQIFKHEIAHIQQKHTYDKLFVNIVLIFCWCNPFFWLYRKELNIIHEFIADKKAVEDSDTSAFAAMILQAAYPKHRFELTNNFFYSPIKRRLMMLTKTDNPRLSYAARLMVLPLAVLVFAAFTFKAKTNHIEKYAITQPLVKNTSDTVPPVSALDLASYNSISNNTDTLDYYKLYGKSKTYKGQKIKSVFIRSTDNKAVVEFVNGKKLIMSQADAFKADIIAPPPPPGLYPNDKRPESLQNNGLVIVDGVIMDDSYVLNNNEILSVNILSAAEAIAKFGERGKKGAIIVTSKNSMQSATEDKPDTEKAIYVLNGKIMGTVHDISKQDNLIAVNTINVKWLKKSEAIAKYGKQGVNGACEVNYNEGAVFTTPYVDADKMSVFYIGMNNPVKISVPNVKPEDLVVNISDGSISGINGNYIVRVTHIGEVTLTLAKRDGTKIPASFTVKVKRLPDPTDPNFPPELRKNLKIDSSNIIQLKQKIIEEQQAKAKLEYAEKELQYKTDRATFEKTGVERKLKEQEILELKQKLKLQQQSKEKLDIEVKQATTNDLEVSTNRAILQEKEIQAQQNNIVFTKAEVSPQFTGGEEAWRKYLRENLKAITPLDEGWDAGIYKVMVKFIVHTDGTVSDVTTENYKGSLTAQHCIEVIKNAPKWQPAVQNGRKVNAYKKQPITFVIEE